MSSQQIVLASDNPGKLAELSALLAPAGVELVTQRSLGIEGAEETAPSFIENALLKARHATHQSGLAALADDSGLAVTALGGAPGIHSARFAGPNASDLENNRKLLDFLSDQPPPRRAAFHCVLVFMRHPADPVPLIVSGRWPGEIINIPRGDGGFGYDPLFLIPDLGRTAAELSPAEKRQYSHRGIAARALLRELSLEFEQH